MEGQGTPVRLGQRSALRPVAVGVVRAPIVVNPVNLGFMAPVPPLGLAYLCAAVRDAGHEVQLVDAAGEGLDAYSEFDTDVGPMGRFGLTPAEAVARLRDGSEVVGIGLMFLHEWAQVAEIAREARLRFPDARIVVGGETATACTDEVFEAMPEVDVVVRGEGERTFVAYLDAIGSGIEPAAGGPLVIRHASPEEPRGLPVRIREVDELPRPAWDLVPLDQYWAHTPHGVDRGRSMPLLASRGCPYKCTFCSAPQMWTTRFVVRDPDDLASEIADYVDRYGIANVNFHDLTAITKRQWTLDLCDALDRNGVSVSWQTPVGTRSEALDPHVLERMHATGCRNLTYAPETGSPRLAKVIDKRVDLDHILASIQAAKASGVSPAMNIIIGHPKERWGDLARSWAYALRGAWAGCDDMSPIRYAPYPGSRDWEELAAEGRVRLDDSTFYGGINRAGSSTPSWNPAMPAPVLRLVQMAMIATFYAVSCTRHPTRPWRAWRAARTGREETHLDELLRVRRDLRGRHLAAARATVPAGSGPA
jgi:radical SAM superfamily enzyme YgiQ (UPF0313 family)